MVIPDFFTPCGKSPSRGEGRQEARLQDLAEAENFPNRNFGGKPIISWDNAAGSS